MNRHLITLAALTAAAAAALGTGGPAIAPASAATAPALRTSAPGITSSRTARPAASTTAREHAVLAKTDWANRTYWDLYTNLQDFRISHGALRTNARVARLVSPVVYATLNGKASAIVTVVEVDLDVDGEYIAGHYVFQVVSGRVRVVAAGSSDLGLAGGLDDVRWNVEGGRFVEYSRLDPRFGTGSSVHRWIRVAYAFGAPYGQDGATMGSSLPPTARTFTFGHPSVKNPPTRTVAGWTPPTRGVL